MTTDNIILGEDCDNALLDNSLNIWIVRHAAVKSNGVLYGGALDLDTHEIEKYAGDFAFLANRLGHLTVEGTSFYSSEQLRAIKTFDVLAAFLEIPKDLRISISPLAEHNYGSLEGHDFEYLCRLAGGTWKELYSSIKSGDLEEIKNKIKILDTDKQSAIPGWSKLQEQLKEGAVKECETIHSFYDGCMSSLELINEDLQDRDSEINNVVIVSHRCRIRGLLAALFTLTKRHEFLGQRLRTFTEALDKFETIAIDNLSLTRVVITEGTVDNPLRLFITNINQKRSS